MEPWKESPAYQELMEAYHSRNRYQFLTLITKLVAGATGEERAFWLRIQNYYLVQSCAETHEFRSAWDHLESASQTASGDPIAQEAILMMALAMLYTSQDTRRYVAVRANLRCLPPGSGASWMVLGDRAFLCLTKGYWPRLTNLAARSIATLQAQPGDVLVRNRGHFISLFSLHAIGCFAIGRPSPAEASVREAEALMTEARRVYVSPVTLAQAQAELHLFRGEHQQARTALQAAQAWTEARQVRVTPVDSVAMLMLVSRITRAEGNPEGFRHFCNQALALCHQYHLPFSEARVNALLAGAER